MIGQTELINKLKTYTNNTLPHTILFSGPSGCGKHTITKWLATRLKLEVVQANPLSNKERLDKEQLKSYRQCPVPKMYIFDIDQLSVEAQDQLLKFIEEPTSLVYNVLIASTENRLLPTVLNRCAKFEFAPYSESELMEVQYTAYKALYKVCKTPGQLLDVDLKTFPELLKLCTNIADCIKDATYANTLKLITKINFKEDYDKFDFTLFINTLEYVLIQKCITGTDLCYPVLYEVLNNYKYLATQYSPNKEYYMISLLTDLWEAATK